MRSRRARFRSEASTGCPLVLSNRSAHAPGRPSARASSAAAATSAGVRPSNSSARSTQTSEALTSLSTFWVKVVWRLEISALNARSRAFSGSASRAPARTRSAWLRSSSRSDLRGRQAVHLLRALHPDE